MASNRVLNLLPPDAREVALDMAVGFAIDMAARLMIRHSHGDDDAPPTKKEETGD